MHHFRGKLLQGDKLCLDPANVYVDYQAEESEGPSAWSGYLLIESEKDVVPGNIYTLQLVDGRAGSLRIDKLAPDESEKLRAMFVGQGVLE